MRSDSGGLTASDYARLNEARSDDEFCDRCRELFASAAGVDAARDFRHPCLIPMMAVRCGLVNFVGTDNPRWTEIVPINEVCIVAGFSPDECRTEPRFSAACRPADEPHLTVGQTAQPSER
jgi:hypothetical protein